MDLPLAMQDVWGNSSRPADFPEGNFKEFLIKSGQKINWKADPCADWEDGVYIGTKGAEFEEKWDDLWGMTQGKKNFDPKRMKECLDRVEKRFIIVPKEFGYGYPSPDPAVHQKVKEATKAGFECIRKALEAFAKKSRDKGKVWAEYPNPEYDEVAGGTLLKMLEDQPDGGESDSLVFPLSKGRYVDLTKMPHLLVAGTTGSGKSAFIESMLVSLALDYSREDVKFLLFDPKQVELSRFAGLPHLYYAAVMRDDDGAVTDPDEMVSALNEVEELMRERLSKMKEARARDLREYERKTGDRFYRLVLVIDEFADVSTQMGKAFSDPLGRIAAMSRAAGMHLVLATQKPTREVIRPIIKANVPGRIAFRVASAMDSRVILDETGAEDLLGKGHGIFKHPDYGRIEFQGPWAGEDAVDKLVEKMAPIYHDEGEAAKKELRKWYWQALVNFRWARKMFYDPASSLG